jgi:hypothetical protein
VPLRGSDYQGIHVDYRHPLFGEAPDLSLPVYVLVVSFGLVRITLEKGPIEIAPGTHRMVRKEALRAVEAGVIGFEDRPAFGVVHQAHGQGTFQFAATRLVEDAALQPAAGHMSKHSQNRLLELSPLLLLFLAIRYKNLIPMQSKFTVFWQWNRQIGIWLFDSLFVYSFLHIPVALLALGLLF